MGEHAYAQKCPTPVQEVAGDNQHSWSRKIPCPSNCPCRFSHVDSCVMSQKVHPPVDVIPVSERSIFSSPQLKTSDQPSPGVQLSATNLVSETNNVIRTSTFDGTNCDKLDASIVSLVQENNVLKDQIRELEGKLNSSKVNNKENYHLNRDQLSGLESGITRGREWSTNTLRKGLQLRYSCSTSGYKQVIKQVAPFPSVRTLQRKTQHLKFQPGVLYEILDAFEIEDFQCVRQRLCPVLG